MIDTHKRTDKRAKAREAEAEIYLAPAPSPVATHSFQITNIAPVPLPSHGLNDLFPFSFSAPMQAMVMPLEGADESSASFQPFVSPFLPNLTSQDYLGHGFTFGLDTSLPTLEPTTANREDIISDPSSLTSSAPSSLRDTAVQSFFPAMYSDVNGHDSWVDNLDLDLISGDSSVHKLTSGHSLPWSERHPSINLSVTDMTPQTIPRSSRAPSREYKGKSEVLFDPRSPSNHYKLRPSSHPSYLNATPSSLQQDLSDVLPITLVSPPQQSKAPDQTSGSPETERNATLLHMSIDSGHEGVVRIFLDEGVDINAKNCEGKTALHMAVQRQQEAILRLLLDKDADANATDIEGRAPIHTAIYSDFQAGLKLLLAHKAAVS